jgi:hypothetical protein
MGITEEAQISLLNNGTEQSPKRTTGQISNFDENDFTT